MKTNNNIIKHTYGIYGKKGVGRKTVGWLLAKSIQELLIDNPGCTFEQFDLKFRSWVKEVIENENIIESTKNVTIDSFGEYILDQIRIFCPRLFNDINKSYIHLDTFEIIDNPSDYQVITAKDTDNYTEFSKDWIMTKKEFILYYADIVLKKHFGDSVWINSHRAMSELMNNNNDYHVYWDVKTQAEIDYITQDRSGSIILVTNSTRQKGSGYNKVKNTSTEYIINTTNLIDSAKQFYEILVI